MDADDERCHDAYALRLRCCHATMLPAYAASRFFADVPFIIAAESFFRFHYY